MTLANRQKESTSSLMPSQTHLKRPWLRYGVLAAALIACVVFSFWSPFTSFASSDPEGVEQTVPAAVKEPTAPVPSKRVDSGGAHANAPSDGGYAGVPYAKLSRFLGRLSQLPHYDEDRAARYLNYYGSTRYTDEQIVRLVNTDNDLVLFTDAVPAETDDGILMLVNKYHEMADYEPEDLTDLPAGYASWGALRKEACEAYIAMADAAEADGCPIFCNSPYRSYKMQQGIYNDYVNRHSLELADTYSARPGFSEHQTGLCVDITADGVEYTEFDQSDAFRWMQAHAHEYGYILRYGEGMEYITGYIYEPWHYRYVGVQAAAYIRSHDLTLEEYYCYYVAGGETPT